MSTRLAETAIAQAEDHSEAELRDILDRWSAQVPDEQDFMTVLAGRTKLVDELLAWRDGDATTELQAGDRVTWTCRWTGLVPTGTVTDIANWRGRDEARVDTDTDGPHKVTTQIDCAKLTLVAGGAR